MEHPTTIILEGLARFVAGAALVWNAEYPEAEAEILAGTPVLSITGASVGAGRTVTVTAWWGVQAPDGGFIGAGDEPAYHYHGRRHDGRYGPIAGARKFDRALRNLIAEAEAAGLPVVEVGR